MIRIKKLSVENFKGMRSPTEIDFNNPQDTAVSILAGANGFGKTTIFDAIEVSLTGKFHRIKLFNEVQKKNANRSRPFFQNTDGQDVVIKLLIENTSTGEQFVIIKHYNDTNPITTLSGGRNNLPIESSGFFLTYIINDPDRFNNNDFAGLTEATQEEIDKLIYGTTSIFSLESTYYLFNYIQQEDSLYFLKQSEDTKGKSLGFLFNIVDEEAKQEKLKKISQVLADNRIRLEKEIDALSEQVTELTPIDYKKLFDNKQFAFDIQKPFTNPQSSKDRLLEFQNEINELITLKTNFSPEEFEKYLLFKSLNEEVISNTRVLEAILLRNVGTKEAISNSLYRNEKRTQGELFINRSDKTIVEDKIFELFITEPNIAESYRFLTTEFQKLNSELGMIERIVGDLNQAREKSRNEYEKLVNHKHVSETNCPLCDSQFSSFDELIKQIKNKTADLESHNSKRIDERKSIFGRLEEVCAKVDNVVLEYVNSSKPIERDIENLLRDLPNLTQSSEILIKKHPVLDSPEMASFLFQEIPLTRSEVDAKVSVLKDHLSKSVLVKLQYNEQAIVSKHLYAEYFDSNRALFEKININDLKEKLNYLKYEQVSMANNRLQFLQSRLTKLDRIKENFDKIYNEIYKTIKDFKADMIKKIKIPFYVYSGKILQSYQQGSGIFIDIHQTGQNNNVRFLTGAASDHDIVYHLSSGQMAVVALAFCLSLNKVYNTSQGFKFLAIDDPIQTMDDLNVHTFIELLRNEFSDYQIILSTHDDFTSKYMKYKFDKFGMKTKIHNVQQLVLEQSLT
ncbi:MAG: AAA family ATPase [Ignavibacteria bacterium]|nr:AAA family ATPase [Ignavibacteria bacterium]